MTDSGGIHPDAWLRAIQKRESEATPGPWHFSGEPDAISGIDSMVRSESVLWAYGEHTPGWVEVGDADAEFICAARQDIPHLLELLAKAQAELADAWDAGWVQGWGIPPLAPIQGNPYRTEDAHDEGEQR